jgi:hypothetical protein
MPIHAEASGEGLLRRQPRPWRMVTGSDLPLHLAEDLPPQRNTAAAR